MIVYLVGDSIRMNSESYVHALVPGVEFSSPIENCQHSRSVRQNMSLWAPADAGDIVHMNCGLHDIRHDAGLSHPVCTLSEYVVNLKAVFAELAKTGARVIWATSTPFLEHRHNATKESRRYLRDLERYNCASAEAAETYGFAVNDLCAKVSQHRLEDLMLSDGLHFNATGNAVVGSAIAGAILAEMPTRNLARPTHYHGVA